MNYRTLAYRLSYTPGDPSAINPEDRVDQYIQDRSCRCHFLPLSAAQVVRAGRDSAERQARITYRASSVLIKNGDRVTIRNRTYSVIYTQPSESDLQVLTADLKELEI